MVTHLSHRASLLHASVSFTHSVKALCPVFSVLLCRLLLQKRFNTLTYLSLIPIVLGVMMAANGDKSSSAKGAAMAFIAVVSLAVNGVLTKRLMSKEVCTKWEQMFATNAVTFMLFLPIWVQQDASMLMSHYEAQPESLPRVAGTLVAITGLMILQQGIGFTVISLISPVTYAVTNNMKRVFVILLGAFHFGTQLTTWNLAGIALFTAGVLVYSQSTKVGQPVEEKEKTN